VIGNRRLATALVFGWFVTAACAAPAAEARVSASIAPAELYLGDSAVLSISIEGDTSNVNAPRLPDVQGLTITQTGSPSQSTRIVNGRLVHRSLTYRYVVTAKSVGQYTIPAATVQAGTETLRTNPVTLRVVEAPTGGPLRLSVEASKTECWQLEPVEVAYRWAVRADVDVHDYALNIPLLESGQPFTLRQLPPGGGERQTLSANGQTLEAAVSHEQIEGATFVVMTLRFRLYPHEPGNVSIPPAFVRAVVAKPTNQRNIWGEPVYEQTRYVAGSEGATVAVKALPAEGRPDGFDGAVGRFAVSTTISDTRAHVDDPLRLTITVTGDGLLERVKRPLLSTLPGFAEHFKIKETLEPGEVKDDSVAFEQVIRPKDTDVTEVPPVSLAYFDPDAGRYEIARSMPIPITVLATTSQSIETFGHEADDVAGTELTRRPGGIYANVTSYSALVDQTPSLAPLWALVVPPGAYIVALVATRRRRRLRNDVALARARRARRVWRARLAEAHTASQRDGAAFFDALARAVSGYLSDRLNLGQGELTAADVARLVDEARLPAPIGAQASAILEGCDSARFAPEQADTKDRTRLMAEAEAFGRAAQRALRRVR
jgi:hypothetical protein